MNYEHARTRLVELAIERGDPAAALETAEAALEYADDMARQMYPELTPAYAEADLIEFLDDANEWEEV